jgi:hypothetical protein
MRNALLSLCLVISAGCGLTLLGCTRPAPTPTDPYDAAMKRLVAEQQQLDKIETEIRRIELDIKQTILDDIYTDFSENIETMIKLRTQPGFSELPDHQKQELEKLINDSIKQQQDEQTKRIQRSKELRDEKSPLIQKRLEQLERVEKARKAADDAL